MDPHEPDSAGEHLRRAGRELIAAARTFLDATEELLEDDRVMGDVTGFLGDLADEIATLRGRRGPLRGGQGCPPFEDDRDSASERGRGDTLSESVEGEEDLGQDGNPVGSRRDSRSKGAHDDEPRRSPTRRSAAPRVRRIDVE